MPKQKYFFVHIPKTGGTSLFNWFCRIYGTDRCREHIESMILPAPTAETVEHLSQFDVIGGHIPIDHLMYFAGRNFLPVTVIRDPKSQFFSHINHILAMGVSGDLLCGIQDKTRISIGYFLENATSEELDFFENSQSKPVFGSTFNWRNLPMKNRIEWLQSTYAAVITTETLAMEMSGMIDEIVPAVRQFPRLNTRSYQRDLLTAQQDEILNGLLHEDRALHNALLRQCS